MAATVDLQKSNILWGEGQVVDKSKAGGEKAQNLLSRGKLRHEVCAQDVAMRHQCALDEGRGLSSLC